MPVVHTVASIVSWGLLSCEGLILSRVVLALCSLYDGTRVLGLIHLLFVSSVAGLIRRSISGCCATRLSGTWPNRGVRFLVVAFRLLL